MFYIFYKIIFISCQDIIYIFYKIFFVSWQDMNLERGLCVSLIGLSVQAYAALRGMRGGLRPKNEVKKGGDMGIMRIFVPV